MFSQQAHSHLLRGPGLNVTFLEPLDGTFWVGCIYGRNDDAARFAKFCNFALEYLRRTPKRCARSTKPCM